MCYDHNLYSFDQYSFDQELLDKSPRLQGLISSMFINSEPAKPITFEDIVKVRNTILGSNRWSIQRTVTSFNTSMFTLMVLLKTTKCYVVTHQKLLIQFTLWIMIRKGGVIVNGCYLYLKYWLS